jgi:hypothetical protein
MAAIWTKSSLVYYVISTCNVCIIMHHSTLDVPTYHVCNKLNSHVCNF